MRMQPDVWKLLSLVEPQDRRRLLDSFGIMVVPAPLGEFEHNAALHLVTADGRLVRILGLEDGTQALALAKVLSQAQDQAPTQALPETAALMLKQLAPP
jgi:protein SCO1/2